MTVVLSLYIILGFFGYWKYGDDALGSVTLNIPQEEILAQVTKIMFAITTWISYALQGYVTADIIWHKYLSKRVKDTSKHVLFELLIRAGIVLLTCFAVILYLYIDYLPPLSEREPVEKLAKLPIFFGTVSLLWRLLV
ncbi:Proton-coupled amino acid transporter-like protein [Lucilia cuprina]|nr:Proton-coupled amino acid transporter-like protein [Lucilia cuprina]